MAKKKTRRRRQAANKARVRVVKRKAPTSKRGQSALKRAYSVYVRLSKRLGLPIAGGGGGGPGGGGGGGGGRGGRSRPRGRKSSG